MRQARAGAYLSPAFTLWHDRVVQDAVELTPDQMASRAAWPALGRRHLRANMVMTMDGAIVGPNRTSRSISSPEDHALMLLLRRDCDVILIGAGTARTEGYRRPAVPLAIVSRSLHGLDDVPAVRDDAETGRPRPIIITTASADQQAKARLEQHADLIIAGVDTVDIIAALDALQVRGLQRIHCEGGAHLLGQVIAANALDELFLTISPLLSGATGAHHLVDVPTGLHQKMRVESLATSNGSVFLRLTPDRQSEH